MKSRQGRRPYRVETLAAKQRVPKSGSKKMPHAEKRLIERTSLDPAILTRLRGRMKGVAFPAGSHHVRIGGDSIILKEIATRSGKRHVVASVYGGEMRPPGQDVGGLLKAASALAYILEKEAEKKKKKSLGVHSFTGPALASGVTGGLMGGVLGGKAKILPGAAMGAINAILWKGLIKAYSKGAGVSSKEVVAAAKRNPLPKCLERALEKEAAGPVTEIIGKSGQPPQGIGYRKSVHKALGKAPGLAVNDPVKGTVRFHGDTKDPRVQKALVAGSARARRKRGFETAARPTEEKSALHSAKLTSGEIEQGARRQGFTPEYFKKKGFTPSPHDAFQAKRYRLKPAGQQPEKKPAMSGGSEQTRFQNIWKGKLSPKAENQLRGKEPMYRKQYFDSDAKTDWDPKHRYTPDFGVRHGQTPADPLLAKEKQSAYEPSNAQTVKALVSRYMDREKKKAYEMTSDPSDPVDPKHMDKQYRKSLLAYYSRQSSPGARQKAMQLAEADRDGLFGSSTAFSDLAVGRRPAMKRR